MTQMPDVLPAGTRLGHYVLQCPVGQGAFGVVYRAHHHAWPERLAAIKVPRDETTAAALMRAGGIQGRIGHPGVVRVLDVETEQGQPHLVMEWIEGETLAQRIGRGGPLQLDVAATLLDHIADALTTVHRDGLCHGDLKPSNIMLRGNPAGGQGCPIALTDFGGGPSMAEIRRGLEWSLGSVELPAAVGTLAYMAPEQREGRIADAGADLYSLGVIWFEMLTGRLPALSDRLPDPTADALYRELCAPLACRLTSLPELRARLRQMGSLLRPEGLGAGLGMASALAQPPYEAPAPTTPAPAANGVERGGAFYPDEFRGKGSAHVPAEFRKSNGGPGFCPPEFRRPGVSAWVPAEMKGQATAAADRRLMRRAMWLFTIWLTLLTLATAATAGAAAFLLLGGKLP